MSDCSARSWVDWAGTCAGPEFSTTGFCRVVDEGVVFDNGAVVVAAVGAATAGRSKFGTAGSGSREPGIELRIAARNQSASR